ncbi:hypothetical protein Nepgr_028427 [Nepenthes gracilis]|uniref:BTB domain-containing protein n=1 Tax=Nepenthes gracilis TaxID=150966 RepID=A0AAD3TCU7_NEPGR|nr:hypothetical protein Nepgr_028427 [Nepenthes gracilis]
MAAASAATHLKMQAQHIKPKRRRCRETTISSSAAASATAAATTATTIVTVDSPDNILFSPTPPKPLCIASINPSAPCPPSRLDRNPPSCPDPDPENDSNSTPSCSNTETDASQTNLTIRFSPNRPPLSLSPHMDHSTTAAPVPQNGAVYGHGYTTTTAAFPSSFSKFNSALTAGLLNPMSPPLQTPPQTPPIDRRTRTSPTLFEMMANEADCHPGATNQNAIVSSAKPTMSAQDKQYLMQQRISQILGSRSPGNLFNDPNSSDIGLTLSNKDGFSVSVNVHRQILVGHSRFFAEKLPARWPKQRSSGGTPFAVEIAECDDLEVYIETLRLMYCNDLRRKLMKEDVPKVLGILKVSAAIGFDAAVLSCLEYLEAAPWADDDEEKVASLLSDLRLEDAGASEVLKRVSLDVANTAEDTGNDNEGVLIKLLNVVLEGKDEKAGREMKGLVSKMLRENACQNDLRKESLYSASDGCLQQLRCHFLRVASSDLHDVGQIARQADNLHWILDILIDRQIAEEFLETWASQREMSEAHSKVPPIHRFEVSRVTARLFVGIGKGQLLASKEARCSLLQTWLVPFYDDFGWMRRTSKGLDRHLIEDALSNTILTLPLARQQEILLAWFDRFLNSGKDCPNIQRGFEVWWRRAFWRRNSEPELPRIRIAATESFCHQ